MGTKLIQGFRIVGTVHMNGRQHLVGIDAPNSVILDEDGNTGDVYHAYTVVDGNITEINLEQLPQLRYLGHL